MSIFPWQRGLKALEQAEALLAECCELLSLESKSFSAQAKEWIRRRKWSDDPFEMKQLVFQAALMTQSSVVDVVHFPPKYKHDHAALNKTHFDDLALEEVVHDKIAHFFVRLGHYDITGIHKSVLQQVERPLIRLALHQANGNQMKAARILGINRNTLRSKMKTLGL